MKDCVLFLKDVYRTSHLRFSKKLRRGRFKIAVNGGYSFFGKARLKPDLLTGGLDSPARAPGGISPRTRVLAYPTAKDKTDSESALDYCLEHRALHISIAQPSFGQPDHFVGNLMLPAKAPHVATKRYKPRVRLVDGNTEILLLDSARWAMDNAQGDSLSIIPLSEPVTLSCRGTEYDVTGLRIRRGGGQSGFAIGYRLLVRAWMSRGGRCCFTVFRRAGTANRCLT